MRFVGIGGAVMAPDGGRLVVAGLSLGSLAGLGFFAWGHDDFPGDSERKRLAGTMFPTWPRDQNPRNRRPNPLPPNPVPRRWKSTSPCATSRSPPNPAASARWPRPESCVL